MTTQVVDGLRQFESEIHTNHPIRRRLAAALLVAQCGLLVAGVERAANFDECAGQQEQDKVACYLAQDHLDVPAVTGTEGIDPNATTVLETTTVAEAPATSQEATTTAAPPPPPPPPSPPPLSAPVGGLSLEIAAAAPAQPQELPPRQLPYETFVNNQNAMLGNIPTLDRLNQLFPNSPMAQMVAEQKQRIAELDAAIAPSVDKYHAFHIDMSRSGVFADSQNYHGHITPRAFIIHWTAMGYEGGVDHFVQALKPLRVEFFIDKNAQTFQLFERDTNVPAHGIGINGFAQGVEIETGDYDGVNSPLFGYQPQQLENTIYLAVNFLRRNGLPVDRSTILGHYAADLIFTNPYYDPMSGNFSQNRVRKFDPPEELMYVVVAKAQAIDNALGPR